MAGGSLLAQSTSPIPATGQFIESTVEFAVPTGDLRIGQGLEIRLLSTEPVRYPENWAHFDDVHLNAVLGAHLDCNDDGLVDVLDLDCANAAGITPDLLAALNLLPGDMDGVGGVAFADFVVLSTNFGSALTKYTEGNLDGVNGVAFADFVILSSNFGKSAGATAASVPEPSSLSLLGLVALLLGAARRRGGARLNELGSLA